MSSRAHLKKLRNFDVLSHLSDRQLADLAERVHTLTVGSGELLQETGAAPEQVLFVSRGELKVRRRTGYGDFDLATLGPGDLVGELGLADGNEQPSDILAARDSELLALEASTLRGEERDRAFELALYWAFWKSLSRKLRTANRKLGLFFTADAEAAEEREDKPSPKTRRDLSSTLDLADKRGVFEEQPLSAMEINFLATLSKEERFEPGAEIFREGEPGLKMYVVVEGQVMISTVIPGAGEEALSFLGRGDFFGEMALIDGQPRSADARAFKEGAVVLGISREVLEGILDIHKVSSLRLLKLMCSLVASRLRAIDEKLTGWFVLSGGEIADRGSE